MISNNLAEEFLCFLHKYVDFYCGFLALETNKYHAITQNKVASLDRYLTEEQVFILKSKGMELERDKLTDKTEYKSLTFKELIPMFPPEYQDEISELYGLLSNLLLDLKDLNSNSNTLIQLRLHRIETTKRKMAKHPELERDYDKRANESKGTLNTISKKI